METQTKQQKSDGTSNSQTLSLVWLDNTHGISVENISSQEQLRTLDPNLKTFKDDNECEKYLKSQNSQPRIVLIVNGGLGEKLVSHVQDLSQIISIYVYCWDKKLHEQWAKQITKVKDVVNRFDELKNQIEMNHFQNNSSSDNESISGTFEVDNRYIISDVCINYLSEIKETPNDKNDFLLLCKTEAETSKRKEFLQEFEKKYSPDQVLTWFYTDPNFLPRTLHNAFQSANIETMYDYRILIRDIQKYFQQHKCTTSIHVYHGELMSDEKFEQLKNSEGKIITIKSFLLTNVNRNIATAFTRNLNVQKQKEVLFDIEANPETEGVKPFVKTNLKGQDGILFMLGSLFKINDIHVEDSITVVKMTLCVNDNDHPFKDQLNDTNEQKDLIGFAQLQCNMSQFFSYPRILDNIDKLLEKYLNEIMNDHPDRIRCYDTLGNVTFAKKDCISSLNWYQKSLELQKKILQLNDPKLIDTYNNIGCVYLHKKDNAQALDTFKQMLLYLKQDDDNNFIYCYSKMSGIYESEGKFTEALSCYLQIFSIMLKYYPIDDINLAPIYNNIGKTFTSLCQYLLALAYYETSLQIKEKNLTSPSESVAMTHKSVGIVYKYMGNVNQARTHFEKALEIYRQISSPIYGTVSEIEKLIQTLSSTSQ